MASKAIQIRVNTDVLRALLDENPEAKLELEAFAAEKIAQELVRKFIDKKEADVRILMKDQIDKVLVTPKFPNFELTEFARQLVNEQAKRAIDRALADQGGTLAERVIENAEEKIRTRLNAIVTREREERDAFMIRLQAWWDKGAANLAPEVAQLARDEFMKVIAEVSGVFGPKKEG